MKFLRRFYLGLVFLLPAVLFFSYYPVISLGSNTSTNFELSLPLLWLVLFDIVALLAAVILRKEIKWSKPKPVVGLVLLFTLYAAASVLWSPNHLRGFLTAGIIFVLIIAVFSIIQLTPYLHPAGNFPRLLLGSFLISSALVCLFCWLQCLLDLLGVQRETTLLCLGCTSRTFGFPHPSGFAIEPQFMGNLLLAPTLTALYLLKAKTKSRRQKTALVAFAFLFSATLFLTFSRGAIYAYAVALLILLVFSFQRHFFRPHLLVIPVLSFIFVLLAQGTFAALGPTSDSFLSGVTKSLHQLSLGVLDLRHFAQNTPVRSEKALEAASNSDPSSDQASTVEGPKKAENAPEDPTFDGYVAESTDVRLNLNQAALDTWLSAPGHPESGLSIGLRCFYFCCPCTGSGPLTPTSVFFGVGFGGAGVAMHRNSFMTGVSSPKEIVQNQPLSLLLELGLVGCTLVGIILFLAFRPRSPIWRSPAAPLLISLCCAYFITLQFFSGLPNALHIYLIPPLLYYIFKKLL